jgi:uncharacterized protein YdcH (DUF465 family)
LNLSEFNDEDGNFNDEDLQYEPHSLLSSQHDTFASTPSKGPVSSANSSVQPTKRKKASPATKFRSSPGSNFVTVSSKKRKIDDQIAALLQNDQRQKEVESLRQEFRDLKSSIQSQMQNQTNMMMMMMMGKRLENKMDGED